MGICKITKMAIFAIFISINFSSCGGKKDKTEEGQRALDAAVERHGNAADVQYQYLERREYYKSQGDKKNADYYDQKAKEQSKEVERLRQERERIRKDTYGDVFK